jgi:hypothetical protein
VAAITGRTNTTKSHSCVLRLSNNASTLPHKSGDQVIRRRMGWADGKPLRDEFQLQRQARGGTQDAAPTQGNKVCLTTSWLLANGALPLRHGAIGPPRDLAFRQSPTNGHRTTRLATVATTNQGGMMAEMPTMAITQDMSPQSVGPNPVVQFQVWDESAPQYQGTQMQMGAMFPGQPGIAQASQHQGFVGTAGFVIPGQVQVTQTHQAHGTGGPPGAVALGPAGLAQTPQKQGMQGTQGGPVAGTMSMTTAGGSMQATIGQARQLGSRDAGAGRHGTPAVARPPNVGYSGIGMYLETLGPSSLDPRTVLSMLQLQKDVNRDAAHINAFKTKVGSLLTFPAFFMMRYGSAIIHYVKLHYALMR